MTVETWQHFAASAEAFEAWLQQQGFHCCRHIYSPGTVFPAHSHAVDKVDAVISGQFELQMNAERLVLGPGEFVHIPKNTPHAARVLGQQAVVSIDASRPCED